MVSTKIQEIKCMMSFLDFGKNESFFMPRFILSDGKSFPSISSTGEFFSNQGLCRKPLGSISNNMIEFAHYSLVVECKTKINGLAKTHNVFNLKALLKKFYNLDFIK